MIPTGLAKNRSGSEFGCAFHESAAPCRRHTRPSRAISRRTHEFPCATADPCSLLESWEISNFKLFPRNTALTPNVMHIVQATDLREEPSKCFVVVLAIVDGPRPVVAPLDHGARLQSVRTDLVNVLVLPQCQLWPVAERQQVLQVARPQIGAPLLGELHVILLKAKAQIKLRSIRISQEVLTGSLQRTFLLWSTISKPPV